MIQFIRTLFDKFHLLGIPYKDDESVFNNIANFHFESIYVQDEYSKNTGAKPCIGKHNPVSVSISSNLIQQLVFLCNHSLCETVVAIDASQTYPYLMCQSIPTGLHTIFDADLQICRPRQSESTKFKNTAMSYFLWVGPDCIFESFYKTGTQKKFDWFNADVFCGHCHTLFEAMCCFFITIFVRTQDLL